MMERKRNPAADVIRCFALFLVISVHFFYNNGYYYELVNSKKMYVMTVMREFFIICVPLFIMLSGFLLKDKKVCYSYYKRIGKIIFTYVLAGVSCLIYSANFLNKSYEFDDIIASFFNYTAAPYSWYIEMYLGLFLLIPFLNLIYNNLETQKKKLVLIFSFILLTSLPAVINVYNFSSLDWWAHPSYSSKYTQILPEWWTAIYPVTYYFIGCYLREYGLKITKCANFILIILCTLFSGIYSCWRSYGSAYIWGSWSSYQSLFNVILTTLVFTFFINLDYSNVNAKIVGFLKRLSSLCLGAYLVSFIFDKIFYPILAKAVPIMQERVFYYFVIVPIIFALSLSLSWVLSIIEKLIIKFFGLFFKNVIKRK